MPTKRPTDDFLRLVFVVAILASAFLIFLVQPMVGKRILPWFGGAPAVWALCLAFYQTTLFLGYAYAHCLIRFASPRAQLAVHVCAVAAALIALPVLPGEAWQPSGVETPSRDIAAMLAANVALPFFVLAATGPLVQAWFARRYPERSPYPLYAVSNIGSFAALIAYPFVLEPRFSLSATGSSWSLGFATASAAVLGCAWLARRLRVGGAGVGRTETATGSVGQGDFAATHVALWFGLSGCAVVVMMGVTNSVTLDVASVPFLWVLPLATYLLTFILAFGSERAYRPLPNVLTVVLAGGLTLGLPTLHAWGLAPLGGRLGSAAVQVTAWCVLLFATCMVMHGELYRLRPPPRALTAFYLCVSAGGALGGLFVGLVGPIVFDDHHEARLGVALAAALLVAARAVSAERVSSERGWRRPAVTAIGLVVAGWALWPGQPPQNAIHQERSFFGVLRVAELGGRVPQRQLFSGSTLHGVQFTEPAHRLTPSSYFGRATGIGLALSWRGPRPIRVGVIGLGVGTLSSYGRPGDAFRFYEIDPAVVHIARDAGYFSFLAESSADVEVVVGDGRLALIEEQKRSGSQRFDFLILDAFSSDAIPVHLLTLESLRAYRASLAPGGVIAAHLSNRHFDLLPTVARVGLEVGFESLFVRTSVARAQQSQRAHWVLLSRNPERLRNFEAFARRRVAALGLPEAHLKLERPSGAELAGVALWSDDYSDLLSTLRSK